jgi:hypothetical protein
MIRFSSKQLSAGFLHWCKTMNVVLVVELKTKKKKIFYNLHCFFFRALIYISYSFRLTIFYHHYSWPVVSNQSHSIQREKINYILNLGNESTHTFIEQYNGFVFIYKYFFVITYNYNFKKYYIYKVIIN